MNDEGLTPTGAVQNPYPPRRRRKRWVVALAGLAVAAVLVVAGIAVAGGGGGSESPGVAHLGTNGTAANSGPSSGSGGSEHEQTLAYSKCMREHGISDFPDPTSDGGLALNANGPTSDLDPNSPQFQAAGKACKRLLPNGGQPAPVDPELRDKLLAYSKCMRAHGIGDFPDPTDGGLQIQSTPGSDLDPTNPQFKAADQACKHLVPGGGKGGSTNVQTENGR